MPISNKSNQPSETPSRGLFGRLGDKLAATRQKFTRGLGDLLLGKRAVDEALFEELETLLLSADVGVDATHSLVSEITDRASRKELADSEAVYQLLRQNILGLVQPCSRPLVIAKNHRPFVIMVVGVNGVGKTTTIGKLSQKLKQEGHTVMIAAADTFRAAAIEQIKIWGERAGIPVIAQHTGADAAAVTHDALNAARARDSDVLIVDTAGRQHTHSGLMDELKKIKRVIMKIDETAPHEVLMVLDAGTGQNALAQLHHFHDAMVVSGLCLTKLDGTARGGILIAVAKKTGLPIRYIGVGEKVDDLREFNAEEYVSAIFEVQDTRDKGQEK